MSRSAGCATFDGHSTSAMSAAPVPAVSDNRRPGDIGAAKKKKWPYARPPDISDLRTRICWICREEETFSTRQNPPKQPWIHPCKCTLVAHEACLLEWLARSDGKTTCPQCGTRFIITSRRPWLLKAFEWIGHRTDRVALYGFGCGVTTGFLIVSTVYGAHAMRMFVGGDLYNIVLGGGPSKWPLEAWTNLPWVAPALFMFRISRFDPFLLAMPFLVMPYSDFMNVLHKPINFDPGFTPAVMAYPPTPQVTLALLPLIKVFYSAIWRGIEQWVLREKEEVWEIDREREQVLDDAVEEARQGEEMQNMLGVDMEMVDEDDMDEREQERVGDIDIRLEVAVEIEEEDPPAAPADGDNAPVAQDAEPAPAEQQHVHNRLDLLFNGAPIMRWLRSITYTLCIPTIANLSGHALFLGSHYSLRLRRLLGVEPPLSQYYAVGLSQLNMRGKSLATFTALDPVWWRNTLGLCLFVVMKDSAELLHAWLKREERRSRRVAGRTFAGLEVEGLDLIV